MAFEMKDRLQALKHGVGVSVAQCTVDSEVDLSSPYGTNGTLLVSGLNTYTYERAKHLMAFKRRLILELH